MGTAKNTGHGSTTASGQGAARDVEQLNAFLSGELAAVQAYELALDHLEPASRARGHLETCLRSHQKRVGLLRAAIEQLGGQPAHGAGAWEALVQVIEGHTDSTGDTPTVAALVQGEDHTLAEYHTDLSSLDARSRQMVQFELVPKQLQSHHAIHELRKTLH
jgi:hypothetical protein